VISVLVPTRNRPQNVRRLVDSALETAETDVEFVFYVDEDDDSAVDVIRSYEQTQIVSGPRVVLSETWNECWTYARHDVGMHCGDDIVFRTSGWDTRVLEVFDQYPDKIVFVHGRDGYQDRRVGTHGFLHQNWVDAVGYFVPPYFSSDYNDLWITEVADVLGRRVYLADVYTEHMHPVIGKGEWDQTHRERVARHRRDGVDRTYRRHAPTRLVDAGKLRAVIERFQTEHES